MSPTVIRWPSRQVDLRQISTANVWLSPDEVGDAELSLCDRGETATPAARWRATAVVQRHVISGYGATVEAAIEAADRRCESLGRQWSPWLNK